MNDFEFVWKNYFENKYKHDFEKFIKNYSCVENEKTGKVYYEFWRETIELFQKFLYANKIMLEEERHIVIYILKCEIFRQGMEFYNLYLCMKNLKNNNFESFNIESIEKYLEVFKEIYLFFESRIKTEKIYGI